MTKAIRKVFEHSGLQIAELDLYYAPNEGFSVDTLVSAVRGLYGQHGQANPWRERTDTEWGWVLNRHDATHYAAVEDVAEIMQPEQWLAYANVYWHGDSAIRQRDRVFQNMIHVPTDDGRRAVRAILAVDAARQAPSWTGGIETYGRSIVLDVADLAIDFIARGYALQDFGDKGQQIAKARIETT